MPGSNQRLAVWLCASHGDAGSGSEYNRHEVMDATNIPGRRDQQVVDFKDQSQRLLMRRWKWWWKELGPYRFVEVLPQTESKSIAPSEE
jgi:hypothetical protein